MSKTACAVELKKTLQVQVFLNICWLQINMWMKHLLNLYTWWGCVEKYCCLDRTASYSWSFSWMQSSMEVPSPSKLVLLLANWHSSLGRLLVAGHNQLFVFCCIFISFNVSGRWLQHFLWNWLGKLRLSKFL